LLTNRATHEIKFGEGVDNVFTDEKAKHIHRVNFSWRRCRL